MDREFISADSHVNEPQKLWSERLDKKFRDQAPKVNTTADGKLVFIAPGIPPASVAQGFGKGLSGEALRELLGKGYEAANPGGWDPAARLKDQDVDGVKLEVLYTTLGMRLFAMPDKDLQRDCFRVFNDWMAEFCSYAPKRLKGLALISTDDLALGIKELERCAKLGLCGAMIPIIPSEDRPYSGSEYDPLWQAASELNIPLSLHSSTGQRRDSQVELDPATGGVKGRNSSSLEIRVVRTRDIQQSLASLIFGGVFKKFPQLKIVSVENGAGWIAHYMNHLDHLFWKFPWNVTVEGLEKPSYYMRRNIFATFQEDPAAAATCHLYGEDNFMWASDYPHADSTWPYSRKVIARDFGELPAEVTHKIVYENAARLYNLN
jgi:predicted TIM-barrel fold metal-dependent hydrolase